MTTVDPVIEQALSDRLILLTLPEKTTLRLKVFEEALDVPPSPGFHRGQTPNSQLGWRTAGKKACGKVNCSIVVGLLAALLLIAEVIHAQGTPTSENLLARAVDLENKKDYAAAEAIYKQLLTTFPDQPEILTRLGVVYQNQLKYQESVEVFQKILKRAPLYPQVNLFLGISYYALNLFDKAVEAMNHELTANSKDRQTRYYLALALYASNRRLEAIKELEGLVSDNPNDAQALYQLARFYKISTQQTLDRLASSSPDTQWDHALKGEIYADNDKSTEAIREYQEALQKDPNFPGVHFALGQIYWKLARTEQAKEELGLALSEDPNHPFANYYLADMLVKDQKFEEAVPLLQIAVNGNPALMMAQFLMGKTLLALGQVKPALEALLKASELDANHKPTHYHLAQVYARLNDKERSEKHSEIFRRLTEQDRSKIEEKVQPKKMEILKEQNPSQ